MLQWMQGPEMIVIILLVALLFGWKKLPDAARSLGRSMRIFKAEVEEMKGEKPAVTAHPETPAHSVRTETVHTEVTHTPVPQTQAQPVTPPAGAEVHTPQDGDTYRPPMA